VTRRMVTVVGVGHPLISATHAKTLEVTADPSVTSRATCIVAVASRFDGTLDLLRGPVSLRLEVDDEVATGGGIVNPGQRVTDRLVLRRSGAGGPETLIRHSTLTAVVLTASMVRRLQRPEAEVRLTITEEDRAPTGEARAGLVLLDEGHGWAHAGRLASLWAAADVTVDLRHAVRAEALDVLRGAGTLAAVGVDERDPEPVRSQALDRLRALVSAVGGVRVAVSSGDQVVELLLAAGLPPEPVHRLGRLGRARDLAGTAVPGRSPTVIRSARDDVDAVLATVAGAHRPLRVALAETTADVGTAAVWTDADGAGRVASEGVQDDVLLLVPADAALLLGDLRSVAQALIEAGVPPRTVSEVLTPFGLGRRALYASVRRVDESGPAGQGPPSP
jgi:hypothetical protein